ncbi:hypothetical protein KUTeg_021048 [Tegillarca granosa]|uniref:Peptidase M20 dimerisation domain-containing protein n=1 Tax=Tegillarca granosa TaxID=220873 RepID=A0ABQ9E9N0_TEGGR|nr:hypothetical protein KUTeg_021048 [Tegillarca granosa]
MPEEKSSKRRKVEDPAVTKFREYLRIKTVHPTPDYDGALAFLEQYAKDVGLPYKTVEDMKSNGILYLEAIRKMKKAGQRCLRTIHLTFVPDEEVGGKYGMEKFVQHEEYKKLNVGCAVDEGLANPTDAFTVFYGERAPWCHGSRFIENTAAEKFRKVINKFLEFRAQEEKKLKGNACLRLGDVTTVNLTNVQGGLQFNVVPEEMFAGFDIRITPTVNFEEFENKIKQWLEECGEGITYEFHQKCMIQNTTSTSTDDPWWGAFSSACDSMGLKIEPEIFPAATDSRFFRELGIPAIGFSPMNNTPILLHDHNEFLNENIFLKGIDIFCKIIPALADVVSG